MKRLCVGGLVLCAVLLVAPNAGRAGSLVVAEGWDLFETQTGTEFMGFPFTGVPLGTFDFGGAIGVRNTGTADTIVERLRAADISPGPPPGTDTIEIEIIALQLVSVNPINVGAGLDFHYATLQAVPIPPGSMSITFSSDAGGTFDSVLFVPFDLRIGALNGPIVWSQVLPLQGVAVPWGRVAPAAAMRIPGVNHLLNGVNIDEDFWPVAFSETSGVDETHRVGPALDPSLVPEPSTYLLFVLGALVVIAQRRRKGGPSAAR